MKAKLVLVLAVITTLTVGILFVKDVRVEIDASSKDSNGMDRGFRV